MNEREAERGEVMTWNAQGLQAPFKGILQEEISQYLKAHGVDRTTATVPTVSWSLIGTPTQSGAPGSCGRTSSGAPRRRRPSGTSLTSWRGADGDDLQKVRDRERRGSQSSSREPRGH
jgi:hypothetical protein